MAANFVKNPLIVALDLDEPAEALAMAKQLRDSAGCFKVGPRLILRSGPGLIQELAQMAPVFLDFKFYDIPSTMEGALRAAFDMGVTLATIHASAGEETLKHLAGVQRELNKKRPFGILGVTVLTSVAARTEAEKKSVTDRISDLAGQVSSSGIAGLVCSAHEVAALRAKHPNLFFVTPGIRSAQDSLDDQQRTMTAGEAIRHGSSGIVVGRPIYRSPNPAQAARSILSELER
ncbi:MAG TPA: orotidine-5'-phosphate decarboxylase [Bdellovibrionales bacterium]|nr:orotidine-5'-phosphate decarboxylase [Bdellovibrionales bacterium]